MLLLVEFMILICQYELRAGGYNVLVRLLWHWNYASVSLNRIVVLLGAPQIDFYLPCQISRSTIAYSSIHEFVSYLNTRYDECCTTFAFCSRLAQGM